MAPRDFARSLRNYFLTDPRFLSFAQKFPLTRPIARRRSSQLFDLLAGFSYSQILLSCVSLKIFEHVGRRGCQIEWLAEQTLLPVERCVLLVKAASALGLLEISGRNVYLGPHGAAMLAQPWIMRFVEHHIHLYRDLEDPVELLRTGRSGGHTRRYWAYDDDGDKDRYSELMSASQTAVCEQILAAYDFSTHRSLLDVGGGTGTFLKTVGVRYPRLSRNLFDLSAVAGIEAADGVQRHCGDFRCDPLPTGMDIVTLVRVVHDHDDAAVLSIFRNVHAAVETGATLMIAEPFSGNRSTARVTDAYFNLYFAAMGQGRTRTPDEIAALASSSGFRNMRIWRTALPSIAGLLTFEA